MFRYFSEQNLAAQNGQSAAITMKNWLLLILLGFLAIIPVAGALVFLVLYISLAFKQETALSISNYIKANLLVSLISIGIAIVLMVTIGAAALTALESSL